MLRSLRIENFRCFQTFELQQLGRLNLLVGTNNSGKTSILEAIQILYAQNKFDGLRESLVNARDGILLVDEIDSGLHFSAMSKMWKLIWETAKRLNVQVFATTHSSDCWTSLAEIASTEDPSEEGITIHRIEKGKPSSIVFTDRQVVIAAEQGIEVR
jgi:AAA15 family ATPase/GTPase